MMAKSTSRTLCDEYTAAMNERRLDDLDAVLSPDFVSHTRVGDVTGRDRFKELMRTVFDAFPDLFYFLDESILTEDRVVLRYHWEAVQRAPFLGIPPTHKMVRGEGIELIHVRGERLVEIWNYADIMGLAAQLKSRDPFAVGL